MPDIEVTVEPLELEIKVDDSSSLALEVALEGVQGAPGPAGLDKHYAHDQMTASDVWLIAHNLGKYPAVSVVDSAGSSVEGLVEYSNTNQLTVTFSAAFSGKAYCN